MEAELSDAEKGYTVYTRRTLSLYDRFVHGIANCLIWKCPTDELLGCVVIFWGKGPRDGYRERLPGR